MKPISGCACVDEHSEACRERRREYVRVKVKWRARLLAADPTLRPHGELTTYGHWGCRCRLCRDASRVKRYRYPRKSRTPLSEPRVGMDRHGKTQPFGREWVDG